MPRVKKIVESKSVKVKPTAAKAEKGMTIPVYDLKGEIKEEMAVNKNIFSVSGSPALLAHYVRVYLTNQRQGTASTKTRSEIIGSTKKIYKQKGTGRARHGSIKAPIFVGGGAAKGPKPVEYMLKINDKQKRKVMFYTLSEVFKKGNIAGLTDEWLKIEPKTKKVFTFINQNTALKGKKILVVLPSMKNNLMLALRNISKVELVDCHTINPYQIANTEKLIFTQDALKIFESQFIKK